MNNRTVLRQQFRDASLIWFLLLSFAILTGCAGEPGDGEFETVISIVGESWHINDRIINPDSPAQGLLMNVRMVNSVFEDRGTHLEALNTSFDPEANTESFIEKIPEYISSGVNAFTISLQGGMPGYEGAINTAFNPDGSLRKEHLQRAEKVIRASDRNGAAVILSLFYQRQHSHYSALTGKQSIRSALENTVNWITEAGFTNVLLEVSNEYRHGGFRNWTDGEWLMSEEGQIELIRLAKLLNPDLLVSTSGMGDGTFHEDLAREVDFLLIHFNTTALDLYKNRIEEAKRWGKPIVTNEDDKLGPEGAVAQALAVLNGSGWGYMGLVRNQHFPFEFRGAEDDPEVYRMYRMLTTPGFEIDPDTLKHNSLTITYPHDGEIFALGQTVNLNLSHLYSGISEAHTIELFANDEQFTEIESGLRLRVSWTPDKPGIYIFHALVKDESGTELYRSAEVDIIVEPGSPP